MGRAHGLESEQVTPDPQRWVCPPWWIEQVMGFLFQGIGKKKDRLSFVRHYRF
jgi:hypothetical protein